MTSKKILVVDDDPHYLELVAATLESPRVEVRRATSGLQALRAVEEQAPDLVVSDVDMPGMRGLRFRQAFRDAVDGPPTNFVFLTGLEPDSRELETVRPVFSKRWPLEELRQRIHAMLPGENGLALAPTEEALSVGKRLMKLEGGGWWRVRRFLYPRLKRSLDVMVATLALLLLSPLLVVVGLWIKLHDRGPIFYTQERLGRGGKPFRFYKFRSMRVDADVLREQVVASSACADEIRFKDQADPRITPVGRWMRRFSIDELPQLWNVLCGEMTLVGPRPPIREETDRYDSRQWRRLDVKPGLTCSWQTQGRSELDFETQVELDLDYIQERDTVEDMRLLMKTIPAVLGGKGAF